MGVSKNIIIDLMNTSTIEDIEIIGEEWPLRWICPVFNDQYDFESNPLELDKDYEHSGTDESKMISIQSEIIIEKRDENLFIIEEGSLWSESHVWCKKINKSISKNIKKIVKCREKDIFICSTGVIGENIPLRPTNKAISQSLKISENKWESAAKSIMTTDTFPKAIGKKIIIDNKEVSIVGIAKGSGMISPNMATMLAFIFTDALIDKAVLQTLLNIELRNSFNSITVDSDTSTNDTVLAFATGKAMEGKNERIISRTSDPRLIQFREAFSEIMHDLAIQIVKDGEGAKKLIQIKVSGAENSSSAKKIARSIADSPLVKTAVGASDPNWGRIIMAIGKTKEKINPKKISLKIGSNTIIRDGEISRSYSEKRTKKYMKGKNILLDINLGLGKGFSQMWTCDLTEGYIKINADYRS